MGSFSGVPPPRVGHSYRRRGRSSTASDSGPWASGLIDWPAAAKMLDLSILRQSRMRIVALDLEPTRATVAGCIYKVKMLDRNVIPRRSVIDTVRHRHLEPELESDRRI
jgi:hypothetical protein